MHRRVFATRSPSLALLMAADDSLMGSQLHLGGRQELELGIWCDDPATGDTWTRVELWTSGGTLVEARETRGLQQLSWRINLRVPPDEERWYVARVLRGGEALAYSSPIWVMPRDRRSAGTT